MTRPRPSLRFATVCAVTLVLSCAGGKAAKPVRQVVIAPPPAFGVSARAPEIVRIDPLKNSGARKAAGLIALENELHRAMAGLGKGQSAPPYFIGYEVHDRREINISASEGALVASTDQRTRTLSVDVRVGDHKLDSSHPARGGFSGGYDFDAMMGSAVALPLDDQPAAIQAVAWAETDKRYKSAVERLLKIKAEKKTKTAEEDPSDDFSREKPRTFVEPPATLTLEPATWEARMRRLSARFRDLPDIRSARVALDASSVNRWLTNSEGASVQTGRNFARVSIQASTRAEDGMDLERHENFDAADLAGLPDEDILARAVDTIIADLAALRRAPLADPFVGPAILEGKAAAVFFHEIFGHRVEGHRQKKDDEGQTFAKKVGEMVMPDFISVYDDPTIVRIGPQTLNGFYRFDDEAVLAERASLVEGGVLKTFLMGRSPTRNFDHSNGHGRRQEGRDVVARQGNLVVQPKLAVATDELRQRLRGEARRQGKPFGLLFRDISGGFTNTARFMPQSFKVLPILVYRVWADGRPDELLRGVDIVGTPLTSLNKILAAADDYQTFNGFCGAESGYVPVSATSPSLLLQQIEVERREKGSDKPPVLSSPKSAAPTGAADPIRQAMADEMKRSMAELRVDEQPRPHFAAYTVTEGEFLQVAATFGAITSQMQNRNRTLRSDVRVGDPDFDASNSVQLAFGFAAPSGFATLPLDDDYQPIRRVLWLNTDESYKRAVDALAQKKASAGAQAAADDDKIADFAAQAPAQTVSLPVLAPLEPTAMRALAAQLSGLFRSHPLIATSQVNAMQAVGRQRYLSSEGSWADERDSFVRLEVSASTQALDGMRLSSALVFTGRSLAELPATGDLEKSVSAMAQELGHATNAAIPDEGNALVLFEGRAAGQIIKTLLADHLAGTQPAKTGGFEGAVRGQSRELAGKIGQRVTARFLSVYDDPLAERGPGREYLFGSYHADDEGVPAQRVSLIEAGVLKTLLASRTPSKDVPRSNGHGRATQFGAAKAHFANLFVSAKQGLPRAAMLSRLAKEAKARHCEAYIVRLVDDPATAGMFDLSDFAERMVSLFGGGRRGSGAAPVFPLVAYRLKDGKEEPVRGFTLEGLVPKALKDIVAAGREPYVLNFIDGFAGLGVPSAIVAPSLLFADVEIRRQTTRHKKPPLYPHPSFAAK